MLLLPKPMPVVFSYHVAHGTIRPMPAKSIEGASPAWVWSKLSDPEKGLTPSEERPPAVPAPRVVHTPPANERAKIWSVAEPVVSLWPNTAHGTSGFAVDNDPAARSAFVGSAPLTLSALLIPAAASSL